MSKIREEIIVEIDNIRVDQWYYGFDYVIYRNGTQYKHGHLDNDHAWSQDQKGLKAMLKSGYAAQLVLEDLNL